jgi:two-component system, OmpR family, alkaline phosphatase synthesis response regulator PhoP
MNGSILVIDDERDLRTTLTDRLEGEGYNVRASDNGNSGYQEAVSRTYDLIVLDVTMPGKNGFDVCRDLRRAGRTTPILMLTARDQLVDKILGLKLGADDYLVKPFEMLELTTRIEVLLRRAAGSCSEGDMTQQFGSVRIDLRGTAVFRKGDLVPLSAREFQLLRYLLQHRGSTIPRAEILREVWGYSSDTYTRTLDVHIFSLRHKIEDDPKRPNLILTVPGLGYKFAA